MIYVLRRFRICTILSCVIDEQLIYPGIHHYRIPPHDYCTHASPCIRPYCVPWWSSSHAWNPAHAYRVCYDRFTSHSKAYCIIRPTL